jgi:hypothetical protein
MKQVGTSLHLRTALRHLFSGSGDTLYYVHNDCFGTPQFVTNHRAFI